MVSPVIRGTHHRRFQMPVMPHTRLGWWAVGLLLLLAPYPAYWVLLHDTSLPDAWVSVVLAAIALPPLVLGVFALSRRASTVDHPERALRVGRRPDRVGRDPRGLVRS